MAAKNVDANTLSTSLQYQFKEQLCGVRGLEQAIFGFIFNTKSLPCWVRKWPLKLAPSRFSYISHTLRLPDDLTNRPYYQHFGLLSLVWCNEPVFICVSKKRQCVPLLRFGLILTSYVWRRYKMSAKSPLQRHFVFQSRNSNSFKIQKKVCTIKTSILVKHMSHKNKFYHYNS